MLEQHATPMGAWVGGYHRVLQLANTRGVVRNESVFSIFLHEEKERCRQSLGASGYYLLMNSAALN